MKTVWNIALGFLVLSSPGATVTQGHRLPDQKAVQHLERLLVTEADSRAGSDTAKNRADRPVTVSGSGQDITLEYRMRVLSDKMHVSQMQMQAIMYADAASGMGRVESIMRLPMMGEMKTILLTNTGKPGEIIVLNEKNGSLQYWIR